MWPDFFRTILSTLIYCLVFSRPYFSYSRAVFMVVVCLSICPSIRLSVCHRCTVTKRCKIEPMLLLITNRKSHTGFQMTYKSLTLDDLEGS